MSASRALARLRATLARIRATLAERWRGGYEDWMPVGAVVATLIGATVAYVQSVSIKAADKANVESQRLGARAVQVRSAAAEAAQLQYSRFSLLDSEYRNFANALELSITSPSQPHDLVWRRWVSVSSQTLEQSRQIAADQNRALKTAPPLNSEAVLGKPISAITLDGPDGPERDYSFPNDYFADASWEAERLTALRDAANAQASQRESQGDGYAVTLSMFGVAIFLFGFTLTPHGAQRRRLFAGAAGGLVVFALSYALYQGLSTSGRAPDAAASHYANGLVADEKHQYGLAVSELESAIRLRSDFARAHLVRAEALDAKASPHAGFGNPVWRGSEPSLRAEIADLHKARDLGLALIDVPLNLGLDLAKLGMQTHSDSMLAQSAAVSREAEQQDPSNPAPSFNRGLALLARGDTSGARAAYKLGALKSRYSDVKHRSERSFEAAEAFVARALTDLESLRVLTHGRYDREVIDLKQLVVGTVASSNTPPRQSSARIDAIEPQIVDPGWVQWAIAKDSLDPKRDQLSAQWYYRNPSALSWAALAPISGPVGTDLSEPSKLKVAGNQYFSLRSFLAGTANLTPSQPTCLRPGSYRVELYLNGRLAQSAATTLSGPAMTAKYNREMNVALCAPASWKPVRNVRSFPVDSLPGVVAGWADPSYSEGAFMFRLENEFTVKASRNETNAMAGRAALHALSPDWFASVFPNPPTPFGHVTQSHQFLLDLTAPSERSFAYRLPSPHKPGDSGTVHVGVAYDNNDVAIIGAVYGPDSSFQAREPVFDSITQP
jgi:hypothetical protein